MSKNTHHQHSPGRDAQDAPKSANVALKDPVCGMTVTAHSAHRYEHEGTTYYFCGQGCQKKFAADPEPSAAPKRHNSASAWRSFAGSPNVPFKWARIRCSIDVSCPIVAAMR